MADTANVTLQASEARDFMAALFRVAGVERSVADLVSTALVEADLQGAASHGLLQAPNYVRRIVAGTISGRADLRAVHASGAVRVMDAGLALGHAAAAHAMDMAVSAARDHGISAVAVRSGTHFGAAAQPARRAAEAGLVGIVMCNTRAMMPAPGGTRPVVGNNPLAIAVPAGGRPPIVFDMAMSAAAMGRIRMAERRGDAIPEGWAVDAAGRPTTDAGAALGGMLLPAAGPKGFGLALMVDLLCALAGGSNGTEVPSLYGDPALPFDCSWLLLAIDPSHFGLERSYAARVAELAAQAVAGPAAPGAPPPRLPGDGRIEAAMRSDGRITLPAALLEELNQLSAGLGGPALPA